MGRNMSKLQLFCHFLFCALYDSSRPIEADMYKIPESRNGWTEAGGHARFTTTLWRAWGSARRRPAAPRPLGPCPSPNPTQTRCRSPIRRRCPSWSRSRRLGGVPPVPRRVRAPATYRHASACQQNGVRGSQEGEVRARERARAVNNKGGGRLSRGGSAWHHGVATSHTAQQHRVHRRQGTRTHARTHTHTHTCTTPQLSAPRKGARAQGRTGARAREIAGRGGADGAGAGREVPLSP